MNRELMEALDILEKEKNISKDKPATSVCTQTELWLNTWRIRQWRFHLQMH